MDRWSSRVPWISWGLLAAVATLLALSTLWVAFEPAGDETSEAASIIARQRGVLGFLGAGLGLLAAIVSAIPFRRGERWAWYALWLFPVAIGAVAARMLIDQFVLWSYYGLLAVLATAALLIPFRRFVRPPA